MTKSVNVGGPIVKRFYEDETKLIANGDGSGTHEAHCIER